jgi:hypothetical protein
MKEIGPVKEVVVIPQDFGGRCPSVRPFPERWNPLETGQQFSERKSIIYRARKDR